MCSGLAYYLAMKKSPDKIQKLRLVYEDELQRALTEDGQRASVYISPQSYFGDGLHNGICRGKRSLAISDRSGQAFPYTEMVKEWNGSLVHISEFEAKHPQLDPPHTKADAIALRNPRNAKISTTKNSG